MFAILLYGSLESGNFYDRSRYRLKQMRCSNECKNKSVVTLRSREAGTCIMRALVSAGKNVPKHCRKALMSLHVYLPTLFLSLKPWKSCALSGSIEVNKIKLKSAKNMKFAIAVLLFSVIDVKLQLKSVYNTTIIQKSSYSNSNFSVSFLRNPLSIAPIKSLVFSLFILKTPNGNAG